MTAKERMIYALSDMLQNGEKLMHPIYGLLVQGGRQYYGYFGFTEKFLLIALISGKTVTDTIRVPLDINSVKIKKNIFLNEHVIDISFNEGAPCRITAFPKVLAIDSQKENLPQFLSYLKSQTPHKNVPDLSQINGTKIRRQYKEGGRDWRDRCTCQVCQRPPEAEREVWSGILPQNLQKNQLCPR